MISPSGQRGDKRIIGKFQKYYNNYIPNYHNYNKGLAISRTKRWKQTDKDSNMTLKTKLKIKHAVVQQERQLERRCFSQKVKSEKRTLLESQKSLTFGKTFHKLCLDFAVIEEQTLSALNAFKHVLLVYNISGFQLSCC